MSPRDLVYIGHMLDMAGKALGKTRGLTLDAYETDENLRLARLIRALMTTSAREVSASIVAL